MNKNDEEKQYKNKENKKWTRNEKKIPFWMNME